MRGKELALVEEETEEDYLDESEIEGDETMKSEMNHGWTANP